jgi:hypothetical protein
VDYLVAYSDNAPHNYTVIGRVIWSVNFSGANVNGNWQRTDNAGVQFPTGTGIDQQGDPQPAANFQLQPVGPMFRTPAMLDPKSGLGYLYYQ